MKSNSIFIFKGRTKKVIIFLLGFFIQIFVFAQNNLKTYEELISSVHQKQIELGVIYKKTHSIKLQDSIIDAAQFYIYKTIVNEFFNHWYGTSWSFYGQTRIPKYGSIACGYFVTTILYDAGFDIPRVEWAKLASEVFIKKFSRDIKRFRNEPIENIKNYALNKSNGLYIVGLDCHVGFVFKYNDTVKFIHSNYYEPEIGVMSQDFEGNNPLDNSSYVVLGKILDKDALIKWLNQSKFK